jgi:hypothetical protein
MAPGWPPEPLPTNIALANLPITDPRCMNDSCIAFAVGFNQSEKVISLMSQVQYGKWAAWFYSFWLAIFFLVHVYHLISDNKIKPSIYFQPDCPTLMDRLNARKRSFTYRRLEGRLSKLELPSVGVLAILALATLFLGLMPWIQRPYLRELFRFGSPPLSVRCAFIISALTPLVIALAGRVNLITAITGVCYSKLNVFHRFTGYAIFLLATVHAVSW